MPSEFNDQNRLEGTETPERKEKLNDALNDILNEKMKEFFNNVSAVHAESEPRLFTLSGLNLEGLKSCAGTLADRLPPHIWLFLEGTLGAGKTTFVSAFMEQCHAAADLKDTEVFTEVQSPTYTIMNNYPAPEKLSDRFDRVAHLDLYRLKFMDELLYLGLDMVLNRRSLIFIEWPNRFDRSDWKQFFAMSGVEMPACLLQIGITAEKENHRQVQFSLSDTISFVNSPDF